MDDRQKEILASSRAQSVLKASSVRQAKIKLFATLRDKYGLRF
jgi:hypothetical protein